MKLSFSSVLCGAVFVVHLLVGSLGPASAQASPPPPDKIDQLIQLLSDPEVKAWLAAQDAKEGTPPPAEAGEDDSAMAPAGVSSALDVVRKHIREVITAVPTLPAQFARAWIILELEFHGEGENEGLIDVLALILGLVAVGLGLAWLVFRYTQGYRNWMKAMPTGTPQGRARMLGARLVYATIMTVTFIIGTAGVFLAFEWPPLLREIVLGYLMVAIVTWAAMMVTRVLLVPPSLGVPHSAEIRVFEINL